MKISRKIWGSVVFAFGLLWLLGGIFGWFEGKGIGMLILVFCGFVLTRMGWSQMRGQKN